MSSEAPGPTPFQMQVGYDQEELLGARWWHEGLPAPPTGTVRTTQPTTADASRRTALKVLVALGGGLVVAGVAIHQLGGRSDPAVVDSASRDLQLAHGLDYGAKGAPFLFADATPTSATGATLDRSVLASLATDLRPADPAWWPAYVPTLFQAFTAPGGETLARALTMVHSTAMAKAHARGAAVRELLDHAEQPTKWALVVDLPGPESVAFAAALAPTACAVFTFDNWPHPRGVVPAHLTLAAVLYHRERFLAQAPAASAEAPRRPAAFVLDRARLSAYANEPSRFDNRYLAKLPPATFLRQLGVERVLYVVPEAAEPVELADLNARFVEYRAAGLEVRMLGLGDLTLAASTAADRPAGTATPRYYWGGSPGSHWWFWNHYGWPSRPGPVPAERPPTSAFGGGYRPTPRPDAAPSIARLGRTTEPHPSGSSRGTSGGSWGRSSGGFGG